MAKAASISSIARTGEEDIRREHDERDRSIGHDYSRDMAVE